MPRRILQGTVVSDKNPKTVTVLVERRFAHPVLKKTVRRTKKYAAHDEANSAKVGDIVRIQECPPKSRSKRWEVVAQAE
jgi:small subunit ribosomal protein S17